MAILTVFQRLFSLFVAFLTESDLGNRFPGSYACRGDMQFSVCCDAVLPLRLEKLVFLVALLFSKTGIWPYLVLYFQFRPEKLVSLVGLLAFLGCENLNSPVNTFQLWKLVFEVVVYTLSLLTRGYNFTFTLPLLTWVNNLHITCTLPLLTWVSNLHITCTLPLLTWVL